ncbi:hypothetical protein Pla22_29110 [Rubripirellula amarantea]|uniref:Uncharacterized protein n=1 Tax=Rubripirellula amarantea TaxID=2527999 RepID=A0A5C5WJH2_9BACT|nr:hypothetical protein [Rubripirellula amarantea]TWT50171.1 hypothetical protein Pla22_29110 [Rubripirellula amarantea]
MNSAFQVVTGLAAALMLTCTIGCGPKAPTSVDTSTDVAAPAATSNVTANAEMPSSNTTTGAETPAGETP